MNRKNENLTFYNFYFILSVLSSYFSITRPRQCKLIHHLALTFSLNINSSETARRNSMEIGVILPYTQSLGFNIWSLEKKATNILKIKVKGQTVFFRIYLKRFGWILTLAKGVQHEEICFVKTGWVLLFCYFLL